MRALSKLAVIGLLLIVAWVAVEMWPQQVLMVSGGEGVQVRVLHRGNLVLDNRFEAVVSVEDHEVARIDLGSYDLRSDFDLDRAVTIDDCIITISNYRNSVRISGCDRHSNTIKCMQYM
ncbi:hypothetical protein GGQ59_000646 [Parvularcula dongshanensis]|uniref:Uncharacterized protein n=1 Tax=Parvularcula dongshanensis TaxID=1173995 RepID=A0A840HZ76_9PROT|nr:hypothetical protein [Parvularcula dongshanensis]